MWKLGFCFSCPRGVVGDVDLQRKTEKKSSERSFLSQLVLHTVSRWKIKRMEAKWTERRRSFVVFMHEYLNELLQSLVLPPCLVCSSSFSPLPSISHLLLSSYLAFLFIFFPQPVSFCSLFSLSSRFVASSLSYSIPPFFQFNHCHELLLSIS